MAIYFIVLFFINAICFGICVNSTTNLIRLDAPRKSIVGSIIGMVVVFLIMTFTLFMSFSNL